MKKNGLPSKAERRLLAACARQVQAVKDQAIVDALKQAKAQAEEKERITE